MLAIQEHVDPTLIKPYQLDKKRYIEMLEKRVEERSNHSPIEGPYEDLWALDNQQEDTDKDKVKSKRFPPSPEKDLVWFIQEYSPSLEDWQRDIMSTMRDEMLYFWPQMETKIMNEAGPPTGISGFYVRWT